MARPAVRPDLKGEELAVKLRQDARIFNTPLITLSSDPCVDRVKSCLDAGFNEYIAKSSQAATALNEAVNRLPGIPDAAGKKGGMLIVFLEAAKEMSALSGKLRLE